MSECSVTLIAKLGIVKIKPYKALIKDYCDVHSVIATTKRIEQSRLYSRYRITLTGPKGQVEFLRKKLIEFR